MSTSTPGTPSRTPGTTPAKVEGLISVLLRVGVVTSLVVVVTGTVITFMHHPNYRSEPPSLQRLTTPGGAAIPHTIPQILHGVRDLRGQYIVALGLLLLVATPVLRVAVSILAFGQGGDRTYALITTVVLLLLLLSFALGKAGG